MPRSASSEALHSVLVKDGDDITPRDALTALASELLRPPPPPSGARRSPPAAKEQLLNRGQDDERPIEADAVRCCAFRWQQVADRPPDICALLPGDPQTPLAAFAASALLRWNAKEASPEMAAAAAAFVNVSAVAGQKRPREAEESPGRTLRAASGGFRPLSLGSDEDEGSEDENSDDDEGDYDDDHEDDEDEDEDGDNSTEEGLSGDSHASSSGNSSGSDSTDGDIPNEDGHHGSVRRHCLPWTVPPLRHLSCAEAVAFLTNAHICHSITVCIADERGGSHVISKADAETQDQQQPLC